MIKRKKNLQKKAYCDSELFMLSAVEKDDEVLSVRLREKESSLICTNSQSFLNTQDANIVHYLW